MNCNDAQNLIHGYLDGEMDLGRSLEIEGHLQGCPVCARVYESHKALQSGIRNSSLYFKPSAKLRKRIRAALRDADKAGGRPSVRAWPRHWRWFGVAASLVLAAIITWALVLSFSARSTDDLLTQEVISSHVRSLMAENHLTDVASSDQHTVKPWFDGKLDFSPPVEDLADRGFSLVGGRLDYLGNRRVAALIYRRRQHLINLFIWPSAHDANEGKRTLTRQGYNLVRWSKSGMTYWAVSNINSGELQEFVQLVEKSALPTASP